MHLGEFSKGKLRARMVLLGGSLAQGQCCDGIQGHAPGSGVLPLEKRRDGTRDGCPFPVM